MYYLTLAIPTTILNLINQYVYEIKPAVVNWLVSRAGSEDSALYFATTYGNIKYLHILLEDPAFKDRVSDNPIRALKDAFCYGRTDVVDRLLEIPVVRDDAAVCSEFVKFLAKYPLPPHNRSHFEPIIERLLGNPLISNKLIDNDIDNSWFKNLLNKHRRLIKEATLEVARSAYSDLKPTHDMAFPENMNSEYATQYAMGILSNLKFSPGAPNPILNKILSYLPVINAEIFAREAQMLVAERNALIAPKVEEASPTLLIKRKANYENEAKRQKLSIDVDMAAVEQEGQKDLKRKPESQGGSSKRLRQ